MSILSHTISWHEFTAQHSVVHNKIFHNRPLPANPFCDETWSTIILTGGVKFDRDHFAAICEMTKWLAEDFAVIVDREHQFPLSPQLLYYWNDGNFEEAIGTTDLTAVNTDFFGPRGQWGILCTVDSFSVMGAAPRCMDMFLSATGGLGAVQKRFYESYAAGDMDFRGESLEFFKSLTHTIGWPPPTARDQAPLL